jgi:hypothetical protein
MSDSAFIIVPFKDTETKLTGCLLSLSVIIPLTLAVFCAKEIIVKNNPISRNFNFMSLCLFLMQK